MAEQFIWSPMLDTLAEVLAESGGTGWLVGGCLRDALIGAPVHDVDIVLTREPLPIAEQIAQRMSLAVARLGHGTVRLTPRSTPADYLDLTLLQGNSIAADLARRDFTVNALALPLTARTQWIAAIGGQRNTMTALLDPYGGRVDLSEHRIAAVAGDAFRSDPGRIIRAARLRARFGLRPDRDTLGLARQAVPGLSSLSADRLREEMALLLAQSGASDGVDMLDETGALTVLFPGLRDEGARHARATLRQLDLLLGEPGTQALYPALRDWGASRGRRIALRTAAIRHAGEDHNLASPGAGEQFWQQARDALAMDDDSQRLHAARLLLMRVGKAEDTAVDALVVAAACALADGEEERGTLWATRANAIAGDYQHNHLILIPTPLLTGGDLIDALTIPAGAKIGRLLRAVRLAQLAGEISDRAAALALARRLSNL